MSKFGVAVVAAVLVTTLSGAADGRGLLELGPLGGVTRLFAGGLFARGHVHHRHVHVRPAKSAPVEHAPVASQNIPAATNERSGEAKLDVGSLFTAPEARRQIAASAALALWHGGRKATVRWWSHGHDGYGWIGPLFWPFASNDIYGYVILGEGMGFWDYGYPDVYAGIFGPYSNNELAAYITPGSPGPRERKVRPLQQFCGDAEQEVAGLAIDQIQRAVRPTDQQRTAVDHLADASNSAARIIQASCPTQPASTAPTRLAAMQQRTAAILKAVISLEPPLQELYDLLNDDQKKRLNALANDQLKMASANGTISASTQGCEASPPAALQWPAGWIEARLHPNEAQRDALERLQRASAEAVEILSYECQPTDAITPSDRLAAVDRRLAALQQAVNVVSLTLEDFYATLDDVQKSQFELIGPERAP